MTEFTPPTIKEGDPLKRPVIMDNVELCTCTYGYEITDEGMECIIAYDAHQERLGKKPLSELLVEVSDAQSAGYFANGRTVYFKLAARHCTYESLQEVIDHVNMYIEGLDCHWITGAMDT